MDSVASDIAISFLVFIVMAPLCLVVLIAHSLKDRPTGYHEPTPYKSRDIKSYDENESVRSLGGLDSPKVLPGWAIVKQIAAQEKKENKQ